MDDTKRLLYLSSKEDTKARNEIVNSNLNLLRSIAKKFMFRGYEFEELFQVGSIGLIKAAKNFNPDFDVQFSTYAVPLIMGEIQRFIRDDNPIHISRSLKELSVQCLKEKERIETTYNREAKVSEIAKALNISSYDVSEALNASFPPESIYRETNSDEGKSILVLDRLCDDRIPDYISKIMIDQAMEKLEKRERSIIQLRYMKGKTQGEISEILGISQVQVSRLEKKILLKLREICQ